MPDTAPRDYTTGELIGAAKLLGEVSDLLSPTADELMRISDELEPARADDAIHFARTSRHLTATALHLKIGEVTIRRLVRDIGRTYQAIKTRLLGMTAAAMALSLVFHLAALVPGVPDRILNDIGGGLGGYAMGISTAGWILHNRTRPPPGP